MPYISVSINDQDPSIGRPSEQLSLLELRLVDPTNEELFYSLSFSPMSENGGQHTSIFPYEDQAIALTITFGQQEAAKEELTIDALPLEESNEEVQEPTEMDSELVSKEGSQPLKEIDETSEPTIDTERPESLTVVNAGDEKHLEEAEESDPPSLAVEAQPHKEMTEESSHEAAVETSETITSENEAHKELVEDTEVEVLAPMMVDTQEAIGESESEPAMEEEIRSADMDESQPKPEVEQMGTKREDSEEESLEVMDNSEQVSAEELGVSDVPMTLDAEYDGDVAEEGQDEVSDYIDQQMHSYQHLAWELVMFDPEGTLFSLEEAAETIGNFAERGRMDAIYLNFRFRNSLDQLLEELREAEGEIVEVLTQAIENLLKSFLDIIAFSGPKIWGPYTRHTLNDTRQQFRSIPDLEFQEIAANCLDGWREVQGAAFLKKMKTGLGL